MPSEHTVTPLRPTSAARCPSCHGGAWSGAPAQRASLLPVGHAVADCDLYDAELQLIEDDREDAERVYADLARRDPDRDGEPWGAVTFHPTHNAEIALLAALGVAADPDALVRVDTVDGVRTRSFALIDGTEVTW